MLVSRSRRLQLALLVACAALAACAPGALASEVTVVSRDGQSKTFVLEALSGDFDVATEYIVRQSNGAKSTQRIEGISVRRLLELADADPAYSKVDIGNVRMTRTQVEASGAAPAIYPSGGQAAFIRTSYDTTDINARDLFAAGSIVVKQAQVSADDGPIAAASASPKRAKSRQLVTFTAKMSNTTAGQQFTYRWNFDDGSTETGASVKHRFKKRGTYRVLLTATPVGESISSPAAVVVQVGDPVKSNKRRTGSGTNDSAGAPATGAADGDTGAGDQAATEAPTDAKKQRKPQPTSELEVVTGELMSASEPLPIQSSLAARSGQPAEPPKEAFGISGPAMASIFAALLLLAGVFSDSDRIRHLRLRMRGTA